MALPGLLVHRVGSVVTVGVTAGCSQLNLQLRQTFGPYRGAWRLGKAKLKGSSVGCARLQIQTSPYPFCEVLSGRRYVVNGTQVSGPSCVCLSKGLCLFSLGNGSQLFASARPELVCSEWGWNVAPIIFFFFLQLCDC